MQARILGACHFYTDFLKHILHGKTMVWVYTLKNSTSDTNEWKMAHAKIGQRDKPRKGESKTWIACEILRSSLLVVIGGYWWWWWSLVVVIVVVKNHLKDATWVSFSEPKITSSTLSTSTCFVQEKHTHTHRHTHTPWMSFCWMLFQFQDCL